MYLTHSMASSSSKDLVWRLSVIILISLQGTRRTFGFRAYVCSPANKTENLACTNGQWVLITQEIYAPKHSWPSCGVNFTTGCNNAVFAVGLLANCNGPVALEPCAEDVDMEAQMEKASCLKNVDEMAAIVDYDCLPPSTIVDMCSEQTLSLQRNSFHLVSPNFPETEGLRQMCSCTIQGQELKVEFVDVNVKSKLTWTEDNNDSSIPSAVLDVMNSDTTLWNSNDFCHDCDDVILLNSKMSQSLESNEIQVVFADFGIPQQKVWLRIYDHRSFINISCTTSTLPSSRIITTTTSTTTTTTTTTPTTTTTLTTTPTSTTTTTTIPPEPTTTETTPVPMTVPATSTSTQTTSQPVIDTTLSVSADKTSRGPSGGNGRNDNKKDPRKKPKDGGGDNDSAVIVVLVLVVLLLVVAAVVLGVFIYRKRDKFATTNFKPPVWKWMKRFFIKSENPYVERENRDSVIYMHDNEVYGHHIDDGDDDGNNNAEAVKKPIKAGKGENSDDDEDESEYDTDSYEDIHYRGNDTESDPVSLVNTHTYATHQAIVGQEVARIKTERSQKAHDEKLSKKYDGRIENENRDDVKDKREDGCKEKKEIGTPDYSNQHRKHSSTHSGKIQDSVKSSAVQSEHERREKKERSDNSGDRGKEDDSSQKELPQDLVSTQNWPVLSSEEGKMFEALGISKNGFDKNIRTSQDSDNNDGDESHNGRDVNGASSNAKIKEGDLKKSKKRKEEKIANILSSSLMDIRDKLREERSVSGSDTEAGKGGSEC